jgi:putative phage-type endonuclease
MTEQTKHAQRSPEWHAQRAGRLTASMVGAALDLAPYRSQDDCLRDLVRSMHGMESEFQGNIATEYGTNMEPQAKSAYEMETGHTVKNAGFVSFEDWTGASPDGYLGEDGLIEIKCPFGIRKDLDPVFKSLDDQPHYYAQIQIQLFVTGKTWCHFYQWSPHGSKLETVKYDGGWINENLPRLKAFWWKAHEADPKDFEGPKRKLIDTPEAEKLITEYEELSEAIENAQARKKDIIARMVEMSDGKNAVVAGRNLTLVKRKGSVAYAKALAKYAPDADLEPFRGKDSESWQVK